MRTAERERESAAISSLLSAAHKSDAADAELSVRERINEREREREESQQQSGTRAARESKGGRVGEWENEPEPKCFRFSGHCTAYCFELQLLA